MEKYTKVDKFLIINQKVILEVKSGDYPGTYDSRIEDVKPKSILITMPTEKTVTIPLSSGVILDVAYVSEQGRFHFRSKVIKRVKEVIPLLEIEKPDAVYRKELREYFRVNTRAKIKVLLTREEPDGSIKEKLCIASVHDISGGGIRIISECRMEMEEMVEVYFDGAIPGLESIQGRVRRAVALEEGKYEAGLEFIDINNVDRDKVIKYVFKRQLELRKLMG
ncbi:flagellar brake protein [Limisalsivibrio acetivorans]|uniref:flagellar brake protein n=1 Tax=Limisalsivibrio acetivorans TaxID=1304888 RepID=UPI0003B322A1|nr:flagellar brake protein [Limisalsivibrio acetivorans]